MKLFRTVEELRTWREGISRTVGFVPTMGALHEGHMSLVRRSIAETEFTIVSIYVNATQFNNSNDLENYPDTLDADLAQLEEAGVDAVFMPDYAVMYPDDFAYQVEEKAFSTELCGAHRPGHFTGVLTVVMKLLNLVRPARAYFGEKDFQQLSLIRGMVEAFFMNTEIVACPTVREEDGLAMSSRNLNLSIEDRAKSWRFHRILRGACTDSEARRLLEKDGFSVDYVESRSNRRFGAVMMGTPENPVRLIDNVALG